jgi:hypothetical protein
VGLLLALAIVGVVVKKQLSAIQQPVPALAPAGGLPGATTDPAAPPATVREQSQQIQQQYKHAVEGAMQQPRPMPDEK